MENPNQPTGKRNFASGFSPLSNLWVWKWGERPILTISSQLRHSMCRALPFVHALSGCDTTSQHLGCGKKTAWSTWISMPEITQVFISLTDKPECFTNDSEIMKSLERFCIIMYSKTCNAANLNKARLLLFSYGYRTLEPLPPTNAAYYQHLIRSILQTCYIYGISQWNPFKQFPHIQTGAGIIWWD